MKKRNPSENYKGLLVQFNALYTLVENHEKTNSILSEEVESLKNELLSVDRKEIDALRETNERLTNLLEP